MVLSENRFHEKEYYTKQTFQPLCIGPAIQIHELVSYIMMSLLQQAYIEQQAEMETRVSQVRREYHKLLIKLIINLDEATVRRETVFSSLL